jgi:hypothetical protein
MWGAHLVFHLSTAWSTIWPVVQRGVGDLGAGWLGAPQWRASNQLLSADAVLVFQILLLDAGILLSLYLGWRVTRSYTNRAWDGIRLLAPWAAVAAGLYASGVWMFLQPMQMRGMVHG